MPWLRDLKLERESVYRLATTLVALAAVWRLSTGSTSLASKALGAGVGVLLLVLARRHLDVVIPLTAVLGLLTPILPSALLSVGVPFGAVRPYTYYKDLAVVVVVSCLLDSSRRRPGRLDAVELWGLGFVALVTAYLALPLASSSADALSFNIRLYGWRFDVEWVLFLLAVRRLRLPPRTTSYLLRTLAGMTLVEAAACVYQKLQPSAWNDFLTTTLQVPHYLFLALGSVDANLSDINHYGTGKALRVGGLTVSSLSTGFILTLLIATLAPYAAATKLSRRRLLLLGAALIGLTLTLTRSAVLSALVVLAFVFLQRGTVALAARARAVLLVLGGLVVALPSLLSSSLVDRTLSAVSGKDPSADVHGEGSSRALDLALHHVFGFGLGTNPNVANRFGVVTVTAENTFLQTSLEVGVLGLVLLSGFLVSLVVSNLRTHRALQGSTLHLGAAAAAAGVIAQSFFLEPFSDVPTVYLLAAILGVAQPLARASHGQPPLVVQDEPMTSGTATSG